MMESQNSIGLESDTDQKNRLISFFGGSEAKIQNLMVTNYIAQDIFLKRGIEIWTICKKVEKGVLYMHRICKYHNLWKANDVYCLVQALYAGSRIQFFIFHLS